MEQVQAFKASDGSLFPTPVLCEDHEISLRWRERIDQYLGSDYCEYKVGTHRGMCYKMVLGWEQFKSKEQLDK